MKLKCVAIDDEPLALELVAKFISQTAFLELVSTFENAIEALSFLNQEEVHLVFLDIQMPDLSGMELARILDGKQGKFKPRIIFTTAYNHFAIEGYKVEALDYLLKPFSYEEFFKSATKAFQFFEEKENHLSANIASPSEYIFLKVEYQLIKILLKDIQVIEAYKDYVKVHLQGKTSPILSLTSLKNMEEMLPNDRFMRVHRSFIIGLDHIDAVVRNTVHIGDTVITVSENYKESFMDFLNKWIA
ncbi:LytTR family DNA-binding domain-containing protein [Belliella sp. DSM 111904]|uniref:LytTR family DNA-binding domain-containing protein n=1 Tax=Belliella filtrata TaxID=2923435 RepID=A0ABS9V371_9BACT|nr:LytTR family DNA-binding domain-containing protein [Belliella filtrata]MCH7410857.1 LytTR family DNA-binding domain-containing protein [Belliella filtrata]